MSATIRVLLVDDEKLVLSSLRRLLRREDFEVTTCESGPEGLQHLESHEVDVIVSDFQMPGMNGVEFLKQVAPRWPAIKRCMLTAQADPKQLEAALNDGTLHRAFRKPWDNLELVESLRELAGAAV